MHTKGFTLLEILIAMMMIGILSSIAVPKYQTYLTQSKVTSAYASLNTLKPSVEQFLSRQAPHAKLQLDALDTDHLKQLGQLTLKQKSNAHIELHMLFDFDPIKNQSLSLVRHEGAWRCQTTLKQMYQPYACHTQGATNATSVQSES